MELSKITLAPALPSDFLSIAHLTSAAFAHEEFGIVAFGSHRLTDVAKEAEAQKLAQSAKPGETKHHIKAVTTLSDGTEKIVGFAGWTICTGREGSEEEKLRLGTKEQWAQEEEENKQKGDDEGKHGNAKLRKDAFGKGNEILARASGGNDYMNLFVLVVAPEYQRKGIGKMLFMYGLRIADESGLQVILGASEQGLGLYKNFGCVEFEVMHLKLWEYEGGEGLGVTTNIMLHRPAIPLVGRP